jgi:hypothetical protein
MIILLTNCGGGGSGYTPAVIPGIAGQWEFLASSTMNVGLQTYIETNLQEGQQLVAGMSVPNGQVSASGSQQIAILTVDSAGNVKFSGSCAGTGLNDVTGTVDSNYDVLLTYNENGNAFNVKATLSSDHKTILGTYTSQSGSGCTDRGTFTGTALAKLGGMYTGVMCPPTSTSCQYPETATDNATTLLSQSGSSLKMSFTVTGTDNTGFSVNGPVVGNSFSVVGTFQGQSITYDGYYELTYDCLTQQIDLPSIYLVSEANINMTNPFGQVALLTFPLRQPCPAH